VTTDTLAHPETAHSDARSDNAGKRERTKLANRAAILEAARGVFADLGYEATTVRDIIRGTDLASGTFYNYFKSKEEVFHALHDESVVRIRPLLRAARTEAKDFADFIYRSFHAFFTFVSSPDSLAVVELRSPDRTRVRFETPESLALFDELRADVKAMIADGAAPGIDPDFLAAAAYGMAQEIADQMKARKPLDIDFAANFATTMVLGGLERLTRSSAE
jgi:AcrR family transcriptional regulator